MNKNLHLSRIALTAALVAGLSAAWPVSAQSSAGHASAVVAAAEARLHGKQFRDVKVEVADGTATLTGTVKLYIDKSNAEKQVRRASGVTAVRNLIEVAGPSIDDRKLQAKLGEKLAYDRVGFGNVFNAIGVRVENGVAYLSGHARTYVDKDSALALAATMPGVKDVVDAIEVNPVSSMDDRMRMAVARAVYGAPNLNRYAMDPAKPIRISVENGHVELYGTVDSEMDKNVAALEANSVSGVFSVKNYLTVAGKAAESVQP